MNANAGDGLILAVNAGSSSLKLAGFRIVDDAPKEVLRIGIDLHADAAPSVSGGPALLSAVHSAVLSSTKASPSAEPTAIKLPVERDGGAFVVALLEALHDALTVSVSAVAHRVVHGGNEQRECVAIDDARLAALRALSALAPLHQPSALAIIDAVAAAQPALPQFACLDTAFHAGMPAVARDYALPQHIRARYPELHAYGFHGLSCRSVVERLRSEGLHSTKELPARLIIAHLGSGASVTAVRDGRSIATSMGFSALDGLPMATRPGRIDPGVLLYLLRQEQLDADALADLLYRRSGLLGMSGISGDMRVLLASDDADAQAAVDFFVYRTVVEIGALAAALGGLDALVFTGGIGEHASSIRARVIEGLRWLNADMQVHVVPCDEEAVMVAGALRQRNCQKR